MAIYGTSSGGKKYTIGSQKGQDFVNNAKAGSTLTGADGSTWTKNKDGSTTIVQNGVSYKVGGSSGGSSFQSASSGGSSSRGASSGGGSSGGSSGYTGSFRDYSRTPTGTWNPNAPKYTGGNAELDAYLALKSQEYFAAKANNDARGMADANNAANQARNYFGYAAESATADINNTIRSGSPTGTMSGAGSSNGWMSGGGSQWGGGVFPDFSYQNAPEYIGQWDSIIQDMADQILSRDPFTYNYLEDPNYIALKGMYTREGDRAMQDAIGSVAARTGGMASSYASSAASQANNYFMSQLSDKIPELQQIAYEAYMAGVDSKRDDLSMLMGIDSRDYSRYMDSLSQWNADRSFNYGIYRDQINDQRYEDELSYDKNLAMAQMMAGVGDFSGLASLWGMSDDQVQMLVDAYAKEKQTGESQAARELADWYAQYGDFSKLNGLGVDTSYLTRSQYSSSGGGSGDGNANSGDSDIYQSMYDAGIRSEGDAYAYLVANGYNTTQSGKLAGYYAAWLEDNKPYTPSSDVLKRIRSLESMKGQMGSGSAIANSIVALGTSGSITMDDAEYMLRYFGYNPADYIEYT